jgi:hypothetical protein
MASDLVESQRSRSNSQARPSRFPSPPPDRFSIDHRSLGRISSLDELEITERLA